MALRISPDVSATGTVMVGGRTYDVVADQPLLNALAGIVSYFEGEDVAGADGAAITSVAQALGTAASYAGAATLRTGTNGINGRNALQFNGSSNKLSAASGGASLHGDFYVATVVKFSNASGFQNIFSWGDDADHKRRSLFKGDSYGNYSLDFIVQGIGYDVLSPGQDVLTTDTTYLLEAVSVDGQITLSINGRMQISGTPATEDFASAALIVGANLANGEFFNGLLGALFVHSAPTVELQQYIQNRLASRYGIALPAATFASGVSSASAGNVIWTGGFGPLSTGGTGLTFSTLAGFSVNGNLAAHAGGREHMLTNAWANQNTVLVWNRDPGGFSAIRFGFQADGKEVGAIGFAPPGFAPWGAATYGSFYIEVSNFHDTSKYGIFRLVQTKVDLGPGTDGAFIRMEMQENGEIAFYGQDGTTEILRLKNNGVVNMKNLPTSASGLATGDLWNSSGAVRIV